MRQAFFGSLSANFFTLKRGPTSPSSVTLGAQCRTRARLSGKSRHFLPRSGGASRRSRVGCRRRRTLNENVAEFIAYAKTNPGKINCAFGGRKYVARDSDIFRRVFEQVVEACIAAGLVGGTGFAVDASLIAADANKQRSLPGSEWSNELGRESASRAVKEYLATLDDTAWGQRATSPRSLSRRPTRLPNGRARCADRPSLPIAPGNVSMTATNGSRSFVTACRGQNRSALRGRPGLPLFASLNRGGISHRAGWRAHRENRAGW